MKIISKDKAVEILILSEIKNVSENYILKLHSAFTKKDYVIVLGEQFSDVIERYSKFRLSQSQYINIELGEYEYEFLSDDIVQTFGLLKITSSTDKVTYDSIIPTVSDDDFYVMPSNN